MGHALYSDETESKLCAEVSLPRKYRKYIATIANYLILDSSVNRVLKNRPVFEKIEILEKKITELGISYVIPSKRNQLHFYQIKKYLYDNSQYPKKKLDEAKTRKEKETLLKDYYNKHCQSVCGSHLTPLPFFSPCTRNAWREAASIQVSLPPNNSICYVLSF